MRADEGEVPLKTRQLAGQSHRRLWGRGDLQPVLAPNLGTQWQDANAALEAVREWAERQAHASITWYLEDKRIRRVCSRLLRAFAVILGVSGGLIPVLRFGSVNVEGNVGYVLIGLAAGCVAFDHFFGISSGWMRDIATAQALRARLALFQIAWTRWQAADAGLLDGEPGPPVGGVSAALDLAEGLIVDVMQLIEDETIQWTTDFKSSMIILRRQAGARDLKQVEPFNQKNRDQATAERFSR